MDYRLGLDLGTASIGAVAISLQDNKPSEIIWHAVRIFPEPVNRTTAGLVLKKADRRQARQLRRQIERRARRLRGVAQLASTLGLDKTALPVNTKQNLIALRATAASQRIELSDFYRVLLQLAKQRGYSGSFRRENGKVKGKSDALALAMQGLATRNGRLSVTLGEFLYDRHLCGQHVKLGTDHPDNKEPLCALRSMVKDEFEQIWKTQAQYHPILRDESIKEQFSKAIFYQRPLKSPAFAVGKCLLENNLPRAPRAQMASQAFRIEKTLRDLRWGSQKKEEALSEEQLSVLRELLENPTNEKGKVPFEEIYEALKRSGLQDKQQRQLNLSRNREHLMGNSTVTVWGKMGLLEAWKKLSQNSQITIINLLADLGSPEVLEESEWYNIKPFMHRHFSQEIIDFIDLLKSCDDYDRFSKMGFEGGRSSYSIKALNRLNEWLRDPWWPDNDASLALCGKVSEDTAIRICYPNYFSESENFSGHLSKLSSTGSDIVDVALRELRSTVNKCIDELGEYPKEIVIEMAREVNMGVNVRNGAEGYRKQNEEDRKKAVKEIEEYEKKGTSRNIQRYQLWETQNYKCPYCDRAISIGEALDGHTTNFEHILPRSWTQVDRKQSEIVLAHAACNKRKGQQTPWQAFGNDDERWSAVKRTAGLFKDKATKLAKQAKQAKALQNFTKTYICKKKEWMFKRKAQLLLIKDQVEDDESIDDFVDRQLHQTSWIAKEASKWLKSITKSVLVSRGQFTGKLRNQWSLDTAIPEIRLREGLEVLDVEGAKISQEIFQQNKQKWEGHFVDKSRRTAQKLDKRIDQRHHAIDALIIALTNRSLYISLTKCFRDEYEQEKKGTAVKVGKVIEPPLPNIRHQALKMLEDCHIFYKPNHNVSSKFFQDTAYGISRGQDDKKPQLTVRKSLSKLIDPKSLDKTRKNIDNIASPTVRDIVLKAFEAHLTNGKDYKTALNEPIFYPVYKTRIWKVLCLANRYAEEAICVTHVDRNGIHHKKYLLNESYAYLELRIKDGKPESKLVAYQEANKIGFVKNQENGIIRFFKGDTVLNKADGKKYLIGKYSAQSNGKLFLFPITEARTVSELEKAKTRKTVSGKGLLKLEII